MFSRNSSSRPRVGIVDSVFVRWRICRLSGSIAPPAEELGGVLLEWPLPDERVEGLRMSLLLWLPLAVLRCSIAEV